MILTIGTGLRFTALLGFFGGGPVPGLADKAVNRSLLIDVGNHAEE